MLKMSPRIRSTLLILIDAAHDGLRFLRQMACSRSALAAENLFLRKQLAFYQEHKIRPRRLSNAARFSLLLWSRLFDWQAALAIVKPDTFLRWRREAYKRFWKWKSRAGRPRLPENIRRLIVGMVKENPTWGQARIAAELSVKLGICVSPRTVVPTGRRTPAAKVQGELRLSIGGPLFTITLRRSSLATFSSRSRLPSKSCTCCRSWR